MSLSEIKHSKCFAGDVIYYQHPSTACNSTMTFAVFLPAIAQQQKVPAIFFLSGLTCTHENFITKAGAQRLASELGIALIMPDTSPRDVLVEGITMSEDLGFGAGFYVNATQAPWAPYFSMYDYVVDELYHLCLQELPIMENKISLMGHSMGGHGAMMIGLKNPDKFQSISAFAPICAPMQCGWGDKVFKAYLGDDQEAWKAYDTCEIITSGQVEKTPLFVDQGTADPFLASNLRVDLLQATCAEHQHPLTVKLREGYDHGYYYIASFIDEHLQYHAEQFKYD